MTDTTPEAVDWDDIPDTPEQRALIAAHNAEMKRAYPNLIDLDSLSARIRELKADRGAGALDYCALMEQYDAANVRAEAAEAKLKIAIDALGDCRDELDAYSREEYPADHPVHIRYRKRDYDANPARIALAAIKEQKQ